MVRIILILLLLLLIRLALFNVLPKEEKQSLGLISSQTNIFISIKGKTRDVFLSVLNQEQAELLMGITFGEDVDTDSKKKFITTGVLHVVAASGMNVSMLVSVVLTSLLTFLKRRQAIFVTSMIVIFYGALAEFQPSIVRASIMAMFALGAQSIGRQNTALYALVLTALAMLIFDPTLLTSLSFILSFSATLGIILLDPIFKRGLLKSGLFEDFRTTLSAQIATTPILLFFFGTYSPISIIANLLILWTIPPLMLLGMISAIVSFIFEPIAQILALIGLPLISYFLYVVDYLDKISKPIEIPTIPIAVVCGYYCIFFGLFLLIKRKINK